MTVVYAERTKDDIAAIYDLISIQSRASAQRVEDAIRAQCELLGEFPLIAAKTDEISVFRLPLVHYP